MIRIDLSKNDEERVQGGGTSVPVPKELQTLAAKLKIPPQVLSFLTDARRLATVAIGTAIAMLPHLFFSQYRGYVIAQHEKQIAKLKENLDAVNAEIAKYSAFEKELETYEQQKKLVSERLEGVKALLETRGTPVSVLDAVGQSLPPKAWLEHVVYDFKPDMAQVSMAGLAYTNEDISDFVDKLSESIYLQDVHLAEVGAQENASKVNLKTFSLTTMPKARFPATAKKETAPAVPPPPPPPANVPKKSFFKKGN